MSSTAVSAVPVSASFTSTTGSWPVETPERRRHRISFYQSYSIHLDPASPLSFTEQVRRAEVRISGHRRLILRAKVYENIVSHISQGSSELDYSIQQIDTSGPADHTPLYETVLMRQINGDTLRVLNSCNAFDVMADHHYKTHACARTSQTGHTRSLRRNICMPNSDAWAFLKTCPVCFPVHSQPIASVSVSNNNGGTTSTGALALVATQPVNAVATAKATTATTATSRLESAIERKRLVEWHFRENANRSAQNFVDEVEALVNRVQRDDDASTTCDTVRMLKYEDRLYTTVYDILLAQRDFQNAGKPTRIDLGYHYTKKENVV